jgi:hypothetical protein
MLNFQSKTIVQQGWKCEIKTSTILKWLNLWDWKLLHRGPLEWHQLPNSFHENLPHGPKDIHRSCIPKASNAFGSFLPYSIPLALIAMVTSLPLCRFCPTENCMPLVAIVASAKDCIWCNHSNPTIQTTPNHSCARVKIVHPTNNFESQPF